MSRSVNSESYNPNRAKVEPSDLEGTAALLVIVNADELDIQDPSRPEGFRKAIVLQFEEPAGKALWPNATQTQTLIQMLGTDLDEWIGKAIPVEAKHVKFGLQTYHKVCVMEPREWKEAFDSMGHDYPYKVFDAPKRIAPTATPKKKAAKKR